MKVSRGHRINTPCFSLIPDSPMRPQRKARVLVLVLVLVLVCARWRSESPSY